MATRAETFAKLGILKPEVDPILKNIYEIEEDQAWRRSGDSPHGTKWHTSFHASSFPGDNPKACGRAAMYTMMDIPTWEPIDPHGRAIMDAGKAVEEMIVWRFANAGILLTDDPSAKHQMGFVDEEHWLTGSPDAIILTPPQKLHPIEIKSKDQKALLEMNDGTRSFEPAHRIQLLTYIGLSVENQEELWPEYEPIDSGTLLYVSRDRPRTTHEFKFKYNSDFMEKGRAKLKVWQENFLSHELPQTEKKRHPFGWKWTEEPCKWCNYKKICKQDFKDEVFDLRDSCSVKHALEVRGEYHYDETRQAVLDRWNRG